MYNKVILVGNLTRDIELRYAQSGSAIASTAIATSRKYTVNGERKEDTCFTDITFFGKNAEIANQYLRKGSKILVEGRLNFEQWIDKEGQKRSKHSVVCEAMQMQDSKSDSQASQAPKQAYQAPQQQQYQAPQQQQQYQAPQQQAPQHKAYREQQQYQAPQAQQQLPMYPPAIDVDEDEIPF